MRRLPAVQSLMVVNDRLSVQDTGGIDPIRSVEENGSGPLAKEPRNQNGPSIWNLLFSFERLFGESFSEFFKTQKESAFYEITYLEKCKNGRAFGQFVHSFKKESQR